MKTWMKVLCALLAVLMLSGCSLIEKYYMRPATGEVTQQEPTGDGGIHIYGDEDIFFSGGKLEELMDKVDECFIGESDRATMEDAAAAAIIESLGDRWSYYIPASELQGYNETMNNSYVGIGITIQVREDETGFDVVAVEKTGPAYEAGLLPGDKLTKANGQEVAPLGTDGAAAIIKGEEGTTVEVSVERDGQELTFTVERRTILVTVAEAELIEGNIGLVTINNFDARCFEETKACIENMIAQGATALIFDVRFNPGGYAHEMVALLDYLLPEGEVFITEDYLGNRDVESSDANCLQMPMAVLVNGDSYSAAEFFASALRDYEWATVVGEQTVGKGYFQTTIMLSDGSAINLSVGKYYTRSGISLAEQGGLTPDEVVEVSDEMYLDIYYDKVSNEEDPQLQKAIEVVRGK